MAYPLVNCKIFYGAVQGQITDTYVANQEVTDYEFRIKAFQGYIVDKTMFTDYTAITYPESMTAISGISFEDTIAGGGVGNEVRVIIDVHEGYTISEDTIINIDVGGAAQEILTDNVVFGMLEDISNSFTNTSNPTQSYGIVEVTPGVGVTYTSAASQVPIGVGGAVGYGFGVTNFPDKIHYFSCNIQPGESKKLANIVLKAEGSFVSDAGSLWDSCFMGTGGEDLSDALPHIYPMPGYENLPQANQYYTLELDHESAAAAGETAQVTIENASGMSFLKRTYCTLVIHYPEEPPQWLSDAVEVSQDTFNLSGMWDPTLAVSVYGRLHFTEMGPVLQKNRITSIKTDLYKYNKSSTVIPTEGLIKDKAIVKVYGDPGAKFEVELVETKNVEGGTGGKSAGGGSYAADAGVVPGMPTGVATIPNSGVYSFYFPDIEKMSGNSGYREFEMVFKAGAETRIHIGNSSSDKLEITNPNSVGNKCALKFSQYTRTNITIASEKDSSWSYTHVDYDSPMKVFGGVGANKTGRVNIDVKESAFDFEIRVNKSSSVFSINEINTLNSSSFKASIDNNGDRVSFYNLKAHIGQGLSDTNTAYATVTGTVKVSRYGKEDQTYTLDLKEIFNNVATS